MQDQKSLLALLIGINGYKAVTPLAGCINDVLAVNDYMADLCAKQETPIRWNPTFLLAPANVEEENRLREKGIRYTAPTRQNIIAAFAAFDAADPLRGDHCLLYYSGHGSYTRVPEVFRDCAPTGSLQTLVCVDSRVDGTPDLLDKELGYLIAKTLDGKEPIRDGDGKRPGVHFVAITDSCHSGTNTRGDEQHLTARMTPPGQREADGEGILGFTRAGNCFYEKFEPGQARVKRYGGLKHARYVKLSSAQDAESAFETTLTIPQTVGKPPIRLRHGVFTFSLLATLNQCGANISYGELMRRIQMEVNSRVSGQVPMLDNTDVQDDDLLFLRNEFRTPRQEHQVLFREQPVAEWIMNAGAVHGIVAGTDAQKTTVRVADRIVPVMEVRATESVLDASAFAAADRDNRLLSATIEQMPFPTLHIGFGPVLLRRSKLAAEMRERMLDAWKKNQPQYLAWAADGEPCDLEISRIRNRNGSHAFALTRPGNRTPLFERHDSAETFLADAGKVARFENVLRMSNPSTQIPRSAFRVDVQVLEGVAFDENTLNTVFDDQTLPDECIRRYTDPDAIEASYMHVRGTDQQPAIKVSIAVNGIPDDSYWVGALYCDAQFGITNRLLPVQRLGKDGVPSANLEFRTHEGDAQKWDAIPVMVNENWRKLGVTEITDYVIFFVSNAALPFDLKQYNQEEIKLDHTRSAGFAAKTALKKDDWFTIKIPITIRFPESEKAVAPNSNTVFPGFTLKMPAGVAANVQATNLASAKHRVEQLRSQKSVQDFRTMLPPGTLWTDVEGATETFSRSPVAQPDQALSILELTNTTGRLSEQNPIEIAPDDPLEPDEAILPFAYDEASGLYYPIGYTDERGTVRITEMPRETSGVIGADGVADTRGLLGSVKLFFRKIVWSKISGIHDYQTLALLRKDGDSIERIEYHGRDNQDAVRDQLRTALRDQTNILLLVHGFVGSGNDIAKAVFQHTDIHQRFGTVLTYVYENLGTSNRDTAKALQDLLTKCEVPPKSITVLAHSMGGLVSRWWIEQAGGAGLVQKLVQVGTPNGGSEIADLRKKLINLLTLSLNGWPPLQPYKAILTFIGRGIDGSVMKTVGELQPESEFLAELNAGSQPVPEVPYFLVEGDTAQLEADVDDDDSLWKKLRACLRDRGKYMAADLLFFDKEPNDMVVKAASMRQVPWKHAQVVPVECNHFRYFEPGRALDALAGVLS
ncbi:MAG: caspase family protein [Saprospiraceae bacterium]